jgi:hypothetical protein
MRHDTEGSGAQPAAAVPADSPQRLRPAPGAAADPGQAQDLAPGSTRPARPDSTGNDRVDQAVAALGRLDGLPPGEHVAVFTGVHATLREVLSEIDSAPPDAAGR